MIHTFTNDSSDVPETLVPVDWLERGFKVMPHCVRKDGSVMRLKGFNPSTSAEEYKQEILRCVRALSYPIRLDDTRVQVLCKGLVGIDVDVKRDNTGIGSWTKLKEDFNLPPSPLIIQTKTKGRHFYYRTDGSDDVKSPAPLVTPDHTYACLDIRGGNSFLVAPISLTVVPANKVEPDTYAAIVCDISTVLDLPIIPRALYEAIGTVSAEAKEHRDTIYAEFNTEVYGTANPQIIDVISAVASDKDKIIGTAESRNASLYAYICAQVGKGYMESEVNELGLTFAARCSPPMDEFEARATINSAWHGHCNRPKERILRAFRERYVLLAGRKDLFVVDLKGMPGSNLECVSVFSRRMGNSVKLPVQDVYTEVERDLQNIKTKTVDMFKYAIDNNCLRNAKQLGYRPGAPMYCPVDQFVDAQYNREVRYMINEYIAPKYDIDLNTSLDDSRKHIKNWLTIARHICGDDDDQLTLFLDWLSYIVRNPTMRPASSPLFVNYQGAGRGTVLGFVKYVLGVTNVNSVRQSDITNDFNSLILKKRCVWIDEIPGDMNRAEKNKFISMFNTLVTEPHVTGRFMYLDPVLVENHAVVMMSTNYESGFPFPDNERRVIAFKNLDKTNKPSRHCYADMNTQMEAARAGNMEASKWCSQFAGHIYNFLMKREMGKFDAKADAPMSRAKVSLMKHAATTYIDRLKIDIDNRRGVFKADVVTLDAVMAHLDLFHPKVDVKLGTIKAMTTDSVSPSRDCLFVTVIDHETNLPRNLRHPMINQSVLGSKHTGGEREIRFEEELLTVNCPAFYSVRDHEYWRSASDAEIVMNYMTIDRVGSGLTADFLTDSKKEALLAKIRNQPDKLH